jgi:aspartyl-tRNA(Asn)/glutamyl-tRNA(Gln) amidotransferase subunit A
MPARTITAVDWIENLRVRGEMMKRFSTYMQNFDALIAPTTPIIAPPIAEMEDDEKFRRANGLMLRNTMIANLLDAPSLTLPCHLQKNAPVGLMLTGMPLSDRRLLNIAAAIEQILASSR